jgi:hypothetical protein
MKNSLKNILETVIGSFATQINVVYQIDLSNHSQERQSRHTGTGNDRFITETEIKETVSKGIEKIAKEMILNTIDIGDYVLIKNTKTDLNIVGNLHKNGDKINFVVITVMVKSDFQPKSNTKLIKI